MTQESKTLESKETQSNPPAEDLSKAIEHALDKQPDEEVKTIRVFGDCYRCNWWVRDHSSHTMFAFSTGFIRRSRFLRASRDGEKLVIEDLSGR